MTVDEKARNLAELVRSIASPGTPDMATLVDVANRLDEVADEAGLLRQALERRRDPELLHLDLSHEEVEALHFHYTKNGIPDSQTAAKVLASKLEEALGDEQVAEHPTVEIPMGATGVPDNPSPVQRARKLVDAVGQGELFGDYALDAITALSMLAIAEAMQPPRWKAPLSGQLDV